MDRPFCEKCGKGMYFVGIHLDPSGGLQTKEYQCFSLSSKHKLYETEPIPAWEEFKKERPPPPPQARRMTPRQKRRILKMLAKGMSLVKISQKTGFSSPAIYRLKAITHLAAVGVALRGCNENP